MKIVISPSKAMDFAKKPYFKSSNPKFIAAANQVAAKLQTYNCSKLAKLLEISPKLAELNLNRYQKYSNGSNQANMLQAIFAFKGEVYNGLNVDEFSDADLSYAQEHLRILSGFYGILRPFDLIEPHRLPMGTKLAVEKNNNLYQLWTDLVTKDLNNEINDYVVNLASTEYFKVVNSKNIKFKIITPIFKEKKGNQYKIIMLYAKHARGLMASYIVKNRIAKPDELKDFSLENYKFIPDLSKSTENEEILCFTR